MINVRRVSTSNLNSATIRWYIEQSVLTSVWHRTVAVVFMHKSDLSIHVQTHDKDTWKCAECDWTMTCKKYLQAHLIGQEEDLCYKCDQCDKKCKFREQLRRHKKKRT